MKVPAYQLLVFFVHLCFQFIPHLFSFVSNVEELPRSLTLEVCFHPPSSLPRCPRIWTTLSADVWFFPRAFFNSCGWWKPGKDKNISDKPTRGTSNPTNRPEVPRPRQAEQSYLNPGKPAWPENRPWPKTQRLKPRKEDPPTNKWKQLVKLPLLLVYHYHWTSFSWSCGDQSFPRSNSQPHTMLVQKQYTWLGFQLKLVFGSAITHSSLGLVDGLVQPRECFTFKKALQTLTHVNLYRHSLLKGRCHNDKWDFQICHKLYKGSKSEWLQVTEVALREFFKIVLSLSSSFSLLSGNVSLLTLHNKTSDSKHMDGGLHFGACEHSINKS